MARPDNSRQIEALSVTRILHRTVADMDSSFARRASSRTERGPNSVPTVGLELIRDRLGIGLRDRRAERLDHRPAMNCMHRIDENASCNLDDRMRERAFPVCEPEHDIVMVGAWHWHEADRASASHGRGHVRSAVGRRLS
jgi:hypothetical protein